jgi:hypothetical protein
MRRVLAATALAAAIGLAGCQTDGLVTTGQYTADLTFDGAEKAFNGFRTLCAQKAIPASCRAYVVTGQAIIRKAYAAEQAGNSAEVTAGLQALVAIVTSLQGLKD